MFSSKILILIVQTLPLVKHNCDGNKSEFLNKNYVIVFVNIISNILDIIKVIDIGRSFS